jgi:hypothetical protein
MLDSPARAEATRPREKMMLRTRMLPTRTCPMSTVSVGRLMSLWSVYGRAVDG